MDKDKVIEVLKKTKIKTIELSRVVVEKSKILWAKILKKMPIVKGLCIKFYNIIKAYSIKLFNLIKAKTPIVCKYIKEKSIILYNEAKKNPKQAIVAGIILLFAILLIVFAFSGPKEEEKTDINKISVKGLNIDEGKANKISKKASQPQPTKATLSFTANTEKPLVFDVFYTVKREIWYDASHVVSYQGKQGLHEYEIELPVKEVYRVRLDLGNNPGTVTLSNLKMLGTQNADLTDNTNYDYRNIDNVVVNADGSITITSNQEDPFIIYKKALLPE